MARIKKAQMGSVQSKKKALTDMQRDEMGKPVSSAQKKKQMTDEVKMLEYKGRTPIKKSAAPKRKMKKGGSFPDLNKDGKITKADILKGRGVIKNGGKMKKAKSGMSVTKMANLKGGGKCKYGCK